MKKWASAITAICALFCLVGGIIGFLKAGSAVSLAVGGCSFMVLGTAAIGIWHGYRTATVIALVLALFLDGRFIVAFLKTPKIMPHLMMIILSTATVVATGWTLFQRRSQPSIE